MKRLKEILRDLQIVNSTYFVGVSFDYGFSNVGYDKQNHKFVCAVA